MFQFMRYLPRYILINRWHCQCFMPLQAVTQYLTLLRVMRKLLGKWARHRRRYCSLLQTSPCYRADETKVDVSSVIEHFAILMLDRTSACISVHETRKLLFMRKGCIMAVLPSPETALQQHIKTALQQESCDRGVAMQVHTRCTGILCAHTTLNSFMMCFSEHTLLI